MNRDEKGAAIEVLKGKFEAARHAFLVTYAGLSVAQISTLRRKVRESGSSYEVVKNRLAARAVAGTGLELLASEFKGPTAVAYNATDAVVLAKVLADFVKDHPLMTLRVGVVDGRQVIREKAIEGLAKLPGLPGLRARMLGTLQAPAAQLARILVTPGTQLAQVISARQQNLAGESKES